MFINNLRERSNKTKQDRFRTLKEMRSNKTNFSITKLNYLTILNRKKKLFFKLATIHVE